MAKHLIEFPSDGGGRVVVEMEESLSGTVPATTAGEIAERLDQSFDSVVQGIRPIAGAILQTLTDLGPNNVTVEFGIKFSAKAGVVIASAASEGHCKIPLAWEKPSTS